MIAMMLICQHDFIQVVNLCIFCDVASRISELIAVFRPELALFVT